MKFETDLLGAKLWAVVAATVRPLPGRVAKPSPPTPVVAAKSAVRTPPVPPQIARPVRKAPKTSRPPPIALEPGRHRRLIRGREAAAGTIDLHGLDQDRARSALTGYILRAHAEGQRTVLVITGKGALGDGVLRRRTPEWLAEAPLRAVVSGLSEAHRRHGGEGALYVALKRRER